MLANSTGMQGNKAPGGEDKNGLPPRYDSRSPTCCCEAQLAPVFARLTVADCAPQLRTATSKLQFLLFELSIYFIIHWIDATSTETELWSINLVLPLR